MTAEHRPLQHVFAIEIGFGSDLHGQNATQAAVRACHDALQRNSYPGLRSFLPNQGDLNRMRVHVLLGVPAAFSGCVDLEAVRSVFPYGEITVKVVAGGLCASSGICLAEHGDALDDDRMIIVNAVITLGY